MDQDKLKVFLRLYWIRILVISFILFIFIVVIYLLILGIKSFFTLESFYKKMSLASLPIQLLFSIFTAFIFAGVYTFFHYYFFMGGGLGKLGQKRVKATQVNVKWSDVVGMESVKKEVGEVIALIKDRSRLKKAGGRIIKGVLMVGPPGCGKTYLAKAIATETGLPFLSSVGSEFMGIFVGLGSARIRNLFKQARVLAQLHGGCIIFIDEIDTIARPRVSLTGMGAGMDFNATINQLLTELDGLRQEENNIVVIGATNVSEEELDPALMRAGRFDRKIYVGKPGLEDRKKVFQYYLSKTVYQKNSVNIDILARKTVGFSPADIANMVREASLVAARNKREVITNKDLSEAYDRVVFGLKSEITLSEKEKLWTAYHEAGHAIIAYFTHPTDDVIKASIIPRKGALGYVGHRPPEEIHIHDKEWYVANIKTCLGSFVAEKIKFGTTSSGVEKDFAYALQLAHHMVWRWGMGESGVFGNFYGLSGYDRWRGVVPPNISEKTKEKLDEDTQKIMNKCLKEVEEILTKEKDLLECFAQELLKKGELEYDEIVEIFKTYGKERPSHPL